MVVVWYPEDARWCRPWPTRPAPVIIVILVLVIGITYSSAQVAAMATLFAAITTAIMTGPLWAIEGS